MSEREIKRLQKELEQAKAREEQAKAREEQERRKNQNTTLEEYLYNCHFHLYRGLRLAESSRSSTGFTSVEGKYYPKWLRPWREFDHTLRKQHFEDIKAACKEKRLFHQESTTRDIGSTISRKQAGNENATDHFEKLAVEDPVWEILRPVWDDVNLRAKYRCAGIRFSNNHRDVTIASDRSPSTTLQGQEERRRQTGPSKRIASENRVKPSFTNPDGWGIRTYPSGDESHTFIFDYKAAHKLSAGLVRSAVKKEKLFIEVTQRMCGYKPLGDDTEREREKAEDAVAMALTQVFDYMVRYGVGYGYVAAGSCLLLLHVDRADLQTLYCHACVPETDVDAAQNGHFSNGNEKYTAVAQLASFCLVSLQSKALRGVSLEEALQTADSTLQTWRDPYEDASSSPAKENTESPPDPSSQETGSRYESSASPIDRAIWLRSGWSCKPTDIRPRDKNEDEDEDEGPDDKPADFPSKLSAGKRKDDPPSNNSEGGGSAISDSAPTRQYCTQACLLSLKRNCKLDDGCPNVRLHCTSEGGNRHPIHAEKFTRLVNEQLRQNPYRKCDALDGWGKGGSTGVLFKLELEPYGYTFVGKGALSGHPHDLEHESAIYAQLDRLQGQVVPVHLGIVELDWGHILPGGRRVFDMMLMSWGGEEASKAGLPDLRAEVRRSSQAIWAEGVDHGDERSNNQLWNEERRQVMIIDFDRASLLPPPRNKLLLGIMGSKKRKRNRDESGSPRKRSFLPSQAQVA